MQSPLAVDFLSRLADDARAAFTAVDGLASHVASHLAAARATWPGVDISDEHFLQHLAARMTAARASDFATLPAADLYIACACLDHNAAAISAFERRYFADL